MKHLHDKDLAALLEYRQKYRDLMAANSEIVQYNITLAKLELENKQLRKDLNNVLGKAVDYKLSDEKLEKIKELLNKSYLYSETSIFESNLHDILKESD